jgi:hypothetical protein
MTSRYLGDDVQPADFHVIISKYALQKDGEAVVEEGPKVVPGDGGMGDQAICAAAGAPSSWCMYLLLSM